MATISMSREVDGRLRRFRSGRLERILSGENLIDAAKDEWASTWRARVDLCSFLFERCSKDFLERYLSEDPTLLEFIAKPLSYLEFSAEIDLSIRLFKLNLLPEYIRRTLIETVTNYASNGDDARILIDPELRLLMSYKELARLREAVRTKTLPRIGEVRIEHQEKLKSGDDPEWIMRQFTRLLSSIEEEYSQSKRIRNIVKRERLLVDKWVKENPTAAYSFTPRNIMVDEFTSDPKISRSIFDDIEE